MTAAPSKAPPAPAPVTLGILAGGAASRLGGVDKAWLRRDGIPQVVRLARCFDGRVARVVVGANRDPRRYRGIGAMVVADRVPGLGPLGGLQALALACATPWLLTLPVDLLDVEPSLLPALAAAGETGAFAVDDDGVQPLAALWPTHALREAVAAAIAGADLSVQALQRRMGLQAVRLAGVRFGNLNTFDDLAAAGIQPP